MHLQDYELDIATAVVRLEQIAAAKPSDGMRDLILRRLIDCDVPRLRRHLGPEVLELIASLHGTKAT